MTSTLLVLVSVPGVLAIVNLLKKIGVSGPWCAALAVIIGVVLSVAHQTLINYQVWQAVENGLIIGLGAAGVWDVTRTPARKETIND